MCPAAPLLDIDAGWTDEELVLFLRGTRVGDRIPSNVTMEVNPFSIDPWDLRENMWYLCNSEHSQSQNGKNETKATIAGYWELMEHDLRIMTGRNTVGWKTIWKFYVGQAPFGDRTDWMMHKYQAEPKLSMQLHDFQEYSSLCRLFLQSNPITNHEEQDNPVASDDANGENLELVMPLEEEENDCCLPDAINDIEEVGKQEQRKLATSTRSSQHPVSDDSAENLQAKSVSSKEDYIELNDICSLETSSSSSDNSSLMSLNSDEHFNADALLRDLEPEIGASSSSSDNSSLMSLNSDEYFNADALLRDLEPEIGVDVGEGHADCRFSVTRSTQSSQVVIRPPPSGSVSSKGDNTEVVGENIPSTSISANGVIPGPACSSSAEEPCQQSSGSDTSSQESRTNQTLSGSSQGSRNSQASGSRSVSRIVKLGKKYCCLG